MNLGDELGQFFTSHLRDRIPTGVGSRGAAARGRRARRQHRLNLGLGVLAVLAAGAGAFLLVDRLSDDAPNDELVAGEPDRVIESSDVVSSPIGGSTDGPADSGGGAVKTVWSTTEGNDSTFAYVQHFVAGSGDALYAVSTAAGDVAGAFGPNGPQQVLYRSESGGQEWTELEVGEDLSINALQTAGEKVWVIATTTDDFVPTAVIASSDNGGDWTQYELPERSVPPEVEDRGVYIGQTSLATNEDNVVAVIREYAEGWIGDFVPVPVNGPIAVTDTGISVTNFDECFAEGPIAEAIPLEEGFDGEGLPIPPPIPEAVECEPNEENSETFTFEELGLERETVEFLTTGSTQLVRFTDDGFEAIELPFTTAPNDIQLASTRDGFIVTGIAYPQFGPGTPTTESLRSVDGVTWEPIELPTSSGEEAPWVIGSGVLGEDTVMVTQSFGRRGPITELHRTRDGTNWTTVDINEVLGLDAAGGFAEFQPGIGIGPAGMVVVVVEGTTGGFNGPPVASGENVKLYASENGTDWSVTSLGDLIGEQGVAPYDIRVAVGDETFHVRFTIEEFNNNFFSTSSRIVTGSFAE